MNILKTFSVSVLGLSFFQGCYWPESHNEDIHEGPVIEGQTSIRGAGEIADLADKVFVVFRNKQREKALALRDNNLPHDEKFINQPDVFLKLVKNRQDGTELDFGLYFHKESMQFTSREGRAMPLEGTVDDY